MDADSASLRLAFNRAAETFPTSVSVFLGQSKAGIVQRELLTAWWSKFYEAIRDHAAGLTLLAELATLKEVVTAHTSRVLTTAEAAREWDAMTQPSTRIMIDLSHDLEEGK